MIRDHRRTIKRWQTYNNYCNYKIALRLIQYKTNSSRKLKYKIFVSETWFFFPIIRKSDCELARCTTAPSSTVSSSNIFHIFYLLFMEMGSHLLHLYICSSREHTTLFDGSPSGTSSLPGSFKFKNVRS